MSHWSKLVNDLNVRVAVPLRVVDGTACVWSDAPLCVMARSQLYPDVDQAGGNAQADAWAIYSIRDEDYMPTLWWVSSPAGRPSELPFSMVWDLVHFPPRERIVKVLNAYLESKGL